MKTWHLIIDIARCHDCNDCFLADKDEFVDNDFPPYSAAQPWHGHRWMNIERGERGRYPFAQTRYLPKPCMHCDEAPCLTDDGAVYKRGDGLVIIDPEKAVGRRDILRSCPYGVIYWNDEKQLPQKCTGCAHLLDAGWTETRCSQVCPTGAIRLVMAEEAELAELAKAEGLEVYRPDLATRPRVYYGDLHRWTKAFVAAAVAYGDTDECALGARATVTQDGLVVGEATSDNYGTVLIDRIEPGAECVLRVEAEGYAPLSVPVKVDEGVSLGTLFLEKA